MKAIHQRYGHDRAAVLALQAGADMVMALGSQDEQAAAVRRSRPRSPTDRLRAPEMRRSRARLDALAGQYPVRQTRYAATRRGGGRASDGARLGAFDDPDRDARPPALDQPLRVVTQRSVSHRRRVRSRAFGRGGGGAFEAFGVVEIVQIEDLQKPRLGSAAARRPHHGAGVQPARATAIIRGRWRPQLHLALWNPFQVLDVPAPALVSWGFAGEALIAVRAWLEGRAAAPGHAPVPLIPPAPASAGAQTVTSPRRPVKKR